jgi:hypothetical protein
LSGTVEIRVIATEGHPGLVCSDDAVIPADRFGRGGILAKVLLDKRRLSAPAEDMIPCVLREDDQFI